MRPSDRSRDVGALNLVSTFLASFPPTARLEQERDLASLDRVCEDGVLTLQVEPQGDHVVVRASGELDIASAKDFEDEVVRAIDSPASAVILDLSGLSFIDSTGLRVLLLVSDLSATSATPLRIVQASGAVREVIETSGVQELLPVAGPDTAAQGGDGSRVGNRRLEG
jgi:anti-sigma B factor antagonist